MMDEDDQSATRLRSYKSYLLFKNIIDIFREQPCSRTDLAEKLGIKVEATWHVMRALIRNEVIKIDHYDMSHDSKRAVYRLIKDE